MEPQHASSILIPFGDLQVFLATLAVVAWRSWDSIFVSAQLSLIIHVCVSSFVVVLYARFPFQTLVIPTLDLLWQLLCFWVWVWVRFGNIFKIFIFHFILLIFYPLGPS